MDNNNSRMNRIRMMVLANAAEQGCLSLTQLEEQLARMLSGRLPSFMRTSDSHGNEEQTIEAKDIMAYYNDGELLSIITESKEVWMKYEDGTSVTLKVHEHE